MDFLVATLCVRERLQDNAFNPGPAPIGGGILVVPFVLIYQRMVQELERKPDLIFVTEIRCLNAGELAQALNLLAVHGYVGLNDGTFGPIPILGTIVFIRVAGPLWAGAALLNVNMLVGIPNINREGRVVVVNTHVGVLILVSFLVPAMHRNGVARRMQQDLILAMLLANPFIRGRVLLIGGKFNTPETPLHVAGHVGGVPWQGPAFLAAMARLQLVLASPWSGPHEDTLVLNAAPGVIHLTDYNNHWEVYGQAFRRSWCRADAFFLSTQHTANRVSGILNQFRGAVGPLFLPIHNLSCLPVYAIFTLASSSDDLLQNLRGIAAQRISQITTTGPNVLAVSALLRESTKYALFNWPFKAKALAMAAHTVFLCVEAIPSLEEAMKLKFVGPKSAAIIMGLPFDRFCF